MAALRVSAPNRPTILVDLGPALGRRHWWDRARLPIDEALTTDRQRKEMPSLRQP